MKHGFIFRGTLIHRTSEFGVLKMLMCLKKLLCMLLKLVCGWQFLAEE
ncbi:hypothetical protein BDFB_015303 [Asbolus verrucosus]|uniref:Uncharacterized protein n=1 Tax=Asbolus verrucosus TaxID=1661398 RepID=A0A482VQK6_ASBVE|nr:hypothetical protein BDFB_015303 [Asbolus verrucosus]